MDRIRVTNNEVLAEEIWNDLSVDNMIKTVERFSTLYRYSGTPQGEEAVDYIVSQLKEYGVEYTRYSYEGFFSRPISAAVKRLGKIRKSYPAIAHVYSGSANGLVGELLYDVWSEKETLTENEQDERFSSFTGKVVITWDASPSFTAKAAQYGALAVLGVWKHDNTDLIKHRGNGVVWGTGTTDTEHLFHFLPAATMSRPCGSELIDACRQEEKVEVQIDIEMDTSVCESTMPVAYIPGKSEKYVMLSAHYDSWYEGITDNAAADAILLELARVFKRRQPELRRGIKIAWWSGHSDGHYSGSTWYCDNHWMDIHKNCVGHINLDICGCKNTERILMRTTLVEGMEFSTNIVKELTGVYPDRYIPMIKGADQTFWGAGVPFTIMGQNIPAPGKDGGFKNSGGGPWWHTIDDTLDKLDPDLMLRDAKLNGKMVALLANAEHLPAHPTVLVGEIRKFLHMIDEASTEDFCFETVYQALDDIEPKLFELESEIPKHEPGTTDQIIQEVCGELLRLAYSCASPYGYDAAGGVLNSKPLGAMNDVIGVNRENASPQRFLFIRTGFIRLCNRWVGQLDAVKKMIEYQMVKWQA